MDPSHSSLRKAAILIDSLDARSADALLEQMPERHAAQVRQAVMELPDIPLSERQKIIAEFLGRKPEGPPVDESAGVELQFSDAAYAQADAASAPAVSNTASPASLNTTAHRSEASGPIATPAEPQPRQKPFAFLQQATPETLTGFLQKEHPQVVAVVLAHLAPPQAAEVLGQLSQELQCEVLHRIADLDTADPEILHEVEREIESLLSDHLRLVQRRSAGLAAISAILSAAKTGERQLVMARLKSYDQSLAGQLEDFEPDSAPPAATARPVLSSTSSARPRPAAATAQPAGNRQPPDSPRTSEAGSAKASRPGAAASASSSSAKSHTTTRKSPAAPCLAFADLEQLTDLALAKLLSRAEPQLAILALTGAPEKLVDRLLKQLPPKSARDLRARMENLGPLRLSDIEQAQQQIATLAMKLIQEGAIPAPSTAAPTRFAAAA